MKIVIALLLIVVAAATIRAQSLAPDSTAPSIQQTRPLPPSIISELRRSQKARTLSFHDTIRANDLERQHFNDSSAREFSDSAVAVYDTAVPLSHKEWLDSELVEIPELIRVGTHMHYNYPPSIMTETDLNPVPFDSSLVQRMNPVTLENLPFFDQSPLPQPLTPPVKHEAFIEAGLGTVELPMITAWASQSLSQRTVVQGYGEYHSLSQSESAIHSYADIHALLDAELGVDPAIAQFRSQDLRVGFGYKTKTVAVHSFSTASRTLSEFTGSLSYTGDASKDLHYDASFEDHELGDDIANNLHESSQALMLGTNFNLSSFRGVIQAAYDRASLQVDTSVVANASATHSESFDYIKALLGQKLDHLEWFGGIEYLGGAGIDGSSYSSVLPVGRLRVQITPEIEVGASFEPEVHLSSLRSLFATNPFYSPQIVVQSKLTTVPIDARSVVIDDINLGAFLDYFLTSDNVLHFEARYIERSRAPVFDGLSVDSTTIFTVTPKDIRMIELSGDAKFLLFERDIITANFDMRSATVTADSRMLPYEPSFQFSAGYHSYSIWENVWPSVFFRSISRPGATFAFFDLEAQANLSKPLILTARIDNLLGSASDFWSGYSEYPRSVWASIRYSF